MFLQATTVAAWVVICASVNGFHEISIARKARASKLEALMAERRNRQAVSKVHPRFEIFSRGLLHGGSSGMTQVDIDSCREVTYTCSISLGTPPQRTEVILDTGSADLWILQAAYKHAKSSSYVANGEHFKIHYADGDAVTGYLSEDTLGFGEGLEVPHQIFAEIDDGGHGFGQSCKESGILGLGMDERSHAHVKSPFHSLVETGALERAMFSMLLVDDNGGLLTLGGANPDHFSGALRWFPVLGTQGDDDFDDDNDNGRDDAWLDDEMVGGKLKKWLIPLDHVEVEATRQEDGSFGGGGREIRGGATSALIDTGATLMSAPEEAFALVADDLGAQCWFREAASLSKDDDDYDADGDDYFGDDGAFYGDKRGDHRNLQQQHDELSDRNLETAGSFIGGPCAMALEGGDDEHSYGGGKTYELSFALVPCDATPSLTFTFGDERYSGDDLTGVADDGVDPVLSGRFTLDGKELVRPIPEACPPGEFMDCFGGCFQEDTARSWIGDGSCDGGAQGFSFNCPAFSCDGGDCGGDCGAHGDPGEMCELGIDSNGNRDYWTLGDQFLRRVFVAFDYSEGRVGLAYGAENLPTKAPTKLAAAMTGKESGAASKDKGDVSPSLAAFDVGTGERDDVAVAGTQKIIEAEGSSDKYGDDKALQAVEKLWGISDDDDDDGTKGSTGHNDTNNEGDDNAISAVGKYWGLYDDDDHGGGDEKKDSWEMMPTFFLPHYPPEPEHPYDPLPESPNPTPTVSVSTPFSSQPLRPAPTSPPTTTPLRGLFLCLFVYLAALTFLCTCLFGLPREENAYGANRPSLLPSAAKVRKGSFTRAGVAYNFVSAVDVDDDDNAGKWDAKNNGELNTGDKNRVHMGGCGRVFKGGRAGSDGRYNEKMVDSSSLSSSLSSSALLSECTAVRRAILASSWVLLLATFFFWFWSLKQVLRLGWFNDGFDGCLLVALIVVSLPHLTAISSTDAASEVMHSESTIHLESALEVACGGAQWFKKWVLPTHLMAATTFLVATILLLFNTEHEDSGHNFDQKGGKWESHNNDSVGAKPKDGGAAVAFRVHCISGVLFWSITGWLFWRLSVRWVNVLGALLAAEQSAMTDVEENPKPPLDPKARAWAHQKRLLGEQVESCQDDEGVGSGGGGGGRFSAATKELE